MANIKIPDADILRYTMTLEIILNELPANMHKHHAERIREMLKLLEAGLKEGYQCGG